MKKRLLSLFSIIFTIVFLIGCTDKKVDAANLVVTSEKFTIIVGTSLEINVTVLPSDTTDKTLDWSVLDQTIATVSDQGVLKGIKVGETTLTIKVKNTPKVSKVVNVIVIEEYWLNDEIKEHYGFMLPEFPEYSLLEVKHLENNGLEIVLSGYEDDEAVLEAYDALLVAAGWVAGATNDSHLGNYTKEGINATLTYHNSSSHGTETIEFKIVPHGEVETNKTWADLLEIVSTKFSLTIPNFVGATNISYQEAETEITGTLELSDAHEELEAYLETLEADGWEIKEGSNHHLGIYIKGDFEFYYHESHSVEGQIEFKIIKKDSHHHH